MNENLELIRGSGNVFVAWPLCLQRRTSGPGRLLPEASALVPSEGRRRAYEWSL